MKQLERIALEREAILANHPDLCVGVSEARGEMVAHLDELLALAKETLTEKGDRVYFADDLAEAQAILLDLTKGQSHLVRTRNTEFWEIGFDQLMASRGIEVLLTDLAEILSKEAGIEGHHHPSLSNLEGLSQEAIVKLLQSYLGGDAISDPRALAKLAHHKIRTNVLNSDYGLTGIDGIIAENGTLILAENEGNGRAVSNLPYRHIVVAGYERLYRRAEEGLLGIQATQIVGLARDNATYYSLISGPSRTADIEFRMAYGMHGPLEVHVILLDHGRRDLIKKGCGNLLKCLDCGGCYLPLVQLAKENQWPNTLLTVKNLGLMATRGEIEGKRGLQEMGDFFCPVGISKADLEKAFR